MVLSYQPTLPTYGCHDDSQKHNACPALANAPGLDVDDDHTPDAAVTSASGSMGIQLVAEANVPNIGGESDEEHPLLVDSDQEDGPPTMYLRLFGR